MDEGMKNGWYGNFLLGNFKERSGALGVILWYFW